MKIQPLRCPNCGKISSDIQQTHFCSRGYQSLLEHKDFDRKDRQYRGASSPDQSTGKEGHTLHADYNRQNHLYAFEYRGHGMIVKEADIAWETYPMNVLAEKAAAFIKSVDREVGWPWKPGEQKLSHNEILTQLETVIKR
ncbi:hypothetical protein LCGC14_0442970 [marine sediment metagenome]|uniref:Uncharacterized protein n=1 Tax=marine sediment metagenome TaxID=412755 RepID=A0A0F9T3D2_9ZZZZ